jgi:cytochrome P450
MLLIRNAEEDMDLNGVIIEKDTKVSVDITMIHLHPKYWTNPENFDPDRFAENGEHGTHSGLTWVPFSNGTRQCIGMNFSLTEQRVVLAMMCK